MTDAEQGGTQGKSIDVTPPVRTRRVGDPTSASHEAYRIAPPTTQTGSHIGVHIQPVTGDESKVLEHHPRKAVKAIKTRDSLEGMLVRLRCFTSNKSSVESLFGYQRGMAAATNCLSYTETQDVLGNKLYEWLTFNVSFCEARQFARWAAYYLNIGWWEAPNQDAIDWILEDGTVVYEDGSTESVPFSLQDIVLKCRT